MARKKSQRGGRASAAAIKRAREQAQQKVAAENKKPVSAPVTPVRPNIPTSGFTGTRGTFTPPTFTPTAPVQPPVRPTVTAPPKPRKPQPKPEVPDETGGVLRPKPVATTPQTVVTRPRKEPVAQTPVSVRRPPVAPVAEQSPVAAQQKTKTTDRSDQIPPRTPVAKQTKTFDAAGSTPGTFEYVRKLDDGRFLGGFPGDQSVFNTQEEAEAFVTELQDARQAQIAAREAAATDPDPMRTTMSVTTDDGLLSEYTAEGGVRETKPDGTSTYIPPFKPSKEKEEEEETFDEVPENQIDEETDPDITTERSQRQSRFFNMTKPQPTLTATTTQNVLVFRKAYTTAEGKDMVVQGRYNPTTGNPELKYNNYNWKAATDAQMEWFPRLMAEAEALNADAKQNQTVITGDTGFGPRQPIQTPEYTTAPTMVAEKVDRESIGDQYGLRGDPRGQAINWISGNYLTDSDRITAPQATPNIGQRAQRITGVSQAQARRMGVAKIDAAQANSPLAISAAKGELSEGAIQSAIQNQGLTQEAIAATRKNLDEKAALAQTVDFDLSTNAMIDKVTGATIELAATPNAERQQRQALTGIADEGQAAQIISAVGYDAAQARNFTGEAAKGAAAEMLAQVGNIPENLTSIIVEDPVVVEEMVDTQPVEVQAAIAALPTEALVSSQMENLLAGMDTGEVPIWARPAVELVENNLAQRGLNVSSVGRDSLFNAIIQSAMPIAQSNAQALQARAAQNLSNQQQANLAQTTADMQIRMANLSNRQTASSQTAQFAQNMATLQSQFSQQALLTSAEREQVARLQNLQNQQQTATLNAQNQQAINAQELGNEQQVELAELQLQSTTERENVTAENQRRLTEMQVAADFLAKNAGFKQQMEVANLSNEQQMRLANLTALNQASADNLNVAQQTELANLNKTMQVNTVSAQIAQQMNLAQLNVDQQRAVKNAATVANIDLTKFTVEQQVELANSKFMQSATLADFSAEQQATMQNATAMASLDVATLTGNTKLQAQNAAAFLQMDMANLNNDQQAAMLTGQQQQQVLLSDVAAQNAARQFNATSENQINQFMTQLAQQTSQFNAQSINQMKQFNEQLTEQQDARVAGQEIQVAVTNAEMAKQVDIFNRQREDQRYQFNMQNAVQIEQAYLNYLRNSSLADTAAQNESNRINVQNAFAMSASEQAFMYQQLRDEAAYIRQSYENDETRQTQLYIAAIGNEAAAGEKGKSNHIGSMISAIKTAVGLDQTQTVVNVT
jgi:hypothetical protein